MKKLFFGEVLPWLTIILVICVIATTSSWAKGRIDKTESLGHGKLIAWFYPEMNKKATLITRTIDCEAGIVIYTANSHTYGYAVATSAVPIKDTLLLVREVCDGTDKTN